MGRPRKQAANQKALAKITQEVFGADTDISDIGAILACLKDDVKALEQLKEECTDIDEFLDLAAKRANIALVQAAIEAAIGYEYEETVEAFKNIADYRDRTAIVKEVPNGKKVYKKHSKRDPQLLKFLLSNRLPEYFSDTRKVEINQKKLEIKAVAADEIKGFAGQLAKLLDEADVIEAELVETEK